MKKTHIVVGILLTLVCLVSPSNAQKLLDRQVYEAWTIEYTPFKLLIQNAVENYSSLDIEGKVELPPVSLAGRIIVIRSLTAPDKIYSIWYENRSRGGFIKLPSKQVEYIFGQTLRTTILGKDKYFNLDSNIPFESPDPTAEYAKNLSSWTNSYYQISPLKAIVLINSGLGFSYHWGNELIGLPYRMSGSMRVGVITRYFEIGIVTPPLMQFTNGVLTFTEVDTSISPYYLDPKLYSGFGAFGTVNYQNFHLEMSYSNPPKSLPQDIDQNSFSFLDFSMLGTLGFIIPEDVLPLFGNVVTVKAGFYSVRSRGNSKLLTSLPPGGIASSAHIVKVGSSEWVELDNEYKLDRTGAVVRLEGISNIPAGKHVPRFEYSAQIMTGFYASANFYYNINPRWALGVNFSKKTGDIDYGPEFGTFLDIRVSFN